MLNATATAVPIVFFARSIRSIYQVVRLCEEEIRGSGRRHVRSMRCMGWLVGCIPTWLCGKCLQQLTHTMRLWLELEHEFWLWDTHQQRQTKKCPFLEAVSWLDWTCWCCNQRYPIRQLLQDGIAFVDAFWGLKQSTYIFDHICICGKKPWWTKEDLFPVLFHEFTINDAIDAVSHHV